MRSPWSVRCYRNDGARQDLTRAAPDLPPACIHALRRIVDVFGEQSAKSLELLARPRGIERHTWASEAVMSGMPLLLVAENLGHADTRMVEKHYGHLTQSYKDAMFEKHAPRFGAVEESNVISMEKAP